MNEKTPLYAIVDIETTGGNPFNGGITEVGVFIFDGDKVVDTYHSLINPGASIPAYITGLTGIDDKMVSDAPTFEDLCPELFLLLKDKIFVAHNVNFDYSFLREAFKKNNILLDVPKLCTVRLSRKAFPGFKSYSLGRISEALNIEIKSRHRAMGDAEATVSLFKMILKRIPDEVRLTLNKKSKSSCLPPNISVEHFNELPEATGVYYFHDHQAKIIYIGKAKDIKSRFKSHFSGNISKEKYMGLKTEIHSVSWQLTGNELLALLIELQEIKNHWPKYNQAQKFNDDNWYLIQYEDSLGYLRFQLSKQKNIGNMLLSFESFDQARSFLLHQRGIYELCPKFCGIQKSVGECFDYFEGKCNGACGKHEAAQTYNSRVKEMLENIFHSNEEFFIEKEGRNPKEKSVLFFEKEIFTAYVFCDIEKNAMEVKNQSVSVKAYKESKAILRRYQSINFEG